MRTNKFSFIVFSHISSQSVNYAASAGSVAWGNVTGKPSTYTPASHSHDYLPLSGGTMTGTITLSQSSSDRRVGIVGSYDPNRAAAIWSMGSSYQITAAGTSFGSLYGAAYAYFGSGYTFGAGYSNGHSFVWCQGGTVYAALGNSVWSRGGFIKNGSNDNYALTGGGGHFAIHTGRNNSANALVRTDGNGYIQCGYINSSNGDENNNSSPARVWGTNGSDSYLRTYRTSALSVNYANSAGSVAWSNVSGRPTDLSSFSNGPGYVTASNHSHSSIIASNNDQFKVARVTYPSWDGWITTDLPVVGGRIYSVDVYFTANGSSNHGSGNFIIGCCWDGNIAVSRGAYWSNGNDWPTSYFTTSGGKIRMRGVGAWYSTIKYIESN